MRRLSIGSRLRAARTRRGLVLVALAAALSVAVPQPARADDTTDALSAWQPPEAGGPAWEETGHENATRAPRANSCAGGAATLWERADRGHVALSWSVCGSPELAAELFRVLIDDRSSLRPQPDGVLSGGFDRADSVLHGEGVARYWAEGSAVLLLTTGCAGAVDDACLDQSAEFARSLSQLLPGEPLAAQAADPGDAMQAVFTLPLAFWVLFFAVPRAFSRLREPRYASAAAPGYRDVRMRVRKLKVVRAGRRCLAVAAGLAVLSAAGLIVDGDVVGLVLAAAVAATLVWARTRLTDPLLARRWSRPRGSPKKWVTAGVLSVVSSGATLLVLLTWVPFALVSQVAAVDPGWADRVDPRVVDSPIGLVFLALVEVTRGSPELFLALFVVPVSVLAFLANRLASRFTAASAREVLAHDDRPHFLYLRSFDEDRLKTRVSLMRTGLLSKLAPLRRRRFEEVLVQTLSTFGPVIAISPPGSRLPALGAARASVDHDKWQDQVREWANSAQAVVMSGTPANVRAGFSWELALVAEQIEHHRVMVVFSPWRTKVFRQRVYNFLAHVGQWPFYASLGSVIQEGSHVAVRTDADGWAVLGAPRRSDWSYAVCVDEALQTARAGASVPAGPSSSAPTPSGRSATEERSDVLEVSGGPIDPTL